VLNGTALFMMARYGTLAAFATIADPESIWVLRHCWFASSISLTLPSVFAVDQLIRHPAMTPRKLLLGYAPFLAAYLCVIMFADFTPMPDRIAGWALKLSPGWVILVSIVQSIFVALFVAACAFFVKKIPIFSIRLPLILLAIAHLWMAADGALLALGGWYFRPFLFSEMFTLLCLWYAFESAAVLQRGG